MKSSTVKFIRAIVIKRGKEYKPAPLPLGIAKGQPGDCFDWCMVQAILHPQYRYVEGLALKPDGSGDWAYHAWLTDGTHAFDPTWRAIDAKGRVRPIRTHYIGIEMDIVEVATFVKTTEYKAVLANRWRAPELFAKMRLGQPIIEHHTTFTGK